MLPSWHDAPHVNYVLTTPGSWNLPRVVTAAMMRLIIGRITLAPAKFDHTRALNLEYQRIPRRCYCGNVLAKQISRFFYGS